MVLYNWLIQSLDGVIKGKNNLEIDLTEVCTPHLDAENTQLATVLSKEIGFTRHARYIARISSGEKSAEIFLGSCPLEMNDNRLHYLGTENFQTVVNQLLELCDILESTGRTYSLRFNNAPSFSASKHLYTQKRVGQYLSERSFSQN